MKKEEEDEEEKEEEEEEEGLSLVSASKERIRKNDTLDIGHFVLAQSH